MRPHSPPPRRYRSGYAKPSVWQRFGLTGLLATALAAVVAVVLVVLAVRTAGTDASDVSGTDARALRTDLVRLEGELATLRKSVRDLARQALADLDRSAANRTAQAKRTKLLIACLPQIQNEIDDLQAYLAYGRQPRRNRLSAACANVARPEFTR